MNYPHGLPFSQILAGSVDSLIERIDCKKASLIIIDGGVGEGKSTLLIHIINYINMKRGLPNLDPSGPQLAMGGREFLKKMRECFENKLPCIGYDEGGDFNKRGSLSAFNAMLNRTFETFRAFKCLVIIALPNYAVLDQQLFDLNIPRILIHLHGRTMKQGNFTCYDIKAMSLLKEKLKKNPIKTYARASIVPNFYGHFLDLDPEMSEKLDKISTANKIKILQRSEVLIEGLMTTKEIAYKLGKSVPTILKIFDTLTIKPERSIKGVRYFDGNVMDRCAAQLDWNAQHDKRKGKSGRHRKVGRPKGK